MPRPKSASDAQALTVKTLPDLPDPLVSPTKGILLTPGTAAAKKKNVTFGEHVRDNEDKRLIRNALSEDSPDANLASDSEKEEELLGQRHGRGKLTEALEQARDESRKRKAGSDKRSKRQMDEELDVPAEFRVPKSEVGKYWKNQYDIYRANTQREVKVIIKKQKMAKSFAHEKDRQCTELIIDLKLERQKVKALEGKLEELAALMKDLGEQLTASQRERQDQADEIAMLKRHMGRRDSARPGSSDAVPLLPLERTTSSQKTEQVVARVDDDPVQRPSEPYVPSAKASKPRIDLQTLRARARAKPAVEKQKSPQDIWAQSFATATSPAVSQAQTNSTERDRGAPQPPATSALQTLDINAVAGSKAPQSAEADYKAEADTDKLKLHSTRLIRHGEKMKTSSPDELLQSPSKAETQASYFDQPAAQHGEDLTEPSMDFSIGLPMSSPLEAKTPPTVARTRETGSAVPRQAQTSRPTPLSLNSKENVAPAPPVHKQGINENELRVKPSQLWTSINAPQAGKRNISMTTKDGRQVSQDRLEAARARISARGRVTT